MKTKTKLLFAKIIYFFLSVLKFSTNVKVKRNNINWNLDLSEGIDLSIYLFGKFDPLIIDMAKALNLRKKINIIDIGANIGSHTINFAKELGIEVPYVRPKNLAEDDTSSILVVKHMIEFLKNKEN